MAIYVSIRDGMTQATEADLMHFDNEFIYQAGVVNSASLEVTQRGAGANMSVDVSGGRAWILNSSFSTNSTHTKYWHLLNTATVNVTVPSNSSGNPRIDIIVAEIDTGLSPDSTASNIGSIYLVQGTPAGSPSAPATPSDALKLAEVAVASGATSIVNANITDYREYAAMYIPEGSAIVVGGLATASANTFLYGGTNKTGTPTGDGFRFKFEPTYTGLSGTGDYIVFEKTDGNQTDPDGGFIWLLTGNNGTVEESLEIGGDGNLYLHDANKLYFYNAADSASTYIEQATNFSIVGGASAGYFDIDMSAASGALRLKAGTDIIMYNAGNTNYGSAAYDTNWVFTTTSGEMQLNPAGALRVTSGGNIIFTPSGDVFFTAGASLILRNPTDAGETEIYTDANNDLIIDPQADGDVIVFNREPKRAGASNTYVNVFRQTGWGYVNGDGSRAVTTTVTLPKAYSSQQFRVLVSAVGEKVGIPTHDYDATIGGVWSAQAIAASTSTFTVNCFKTDAAGTTTAGTYMLFHWEAIGSI